MPTNPLVQIARGMHKVSIEVTEHHLRAAAEMHMGRKLHMPFHAEVRAIIVEDERLVVQYTRYMADMRTRETRYQAAYTVADVYTRDAGVWSRSDQFEAIDDTFRPHAVYEAAGEHRDETAQRARRLHEGDCYRPGGGRFPMDNAARTAEGYTTAKMERHWQ